MRALKLLLTGSLCAAAAPVASAQSADVSASVTVVSQGATVVPISNLEFGDQTRGSTPRSSQVPTAAAWQVTHDAAGDFVITFTLPSTLHQGFSESVPITFGSTSAALTIGGTTVAFDPATGGYLGGGVAGQVDLIELGADYNGDGTGDVIVDLLDAVDGTYTGTVTLTYAVP
jgi:hypothetical protein